MANTQPNANFHVVLLLSSFCFLVTATWPRSAESQTAVAKTETQTVKNQPEIVVRSWGFGATSWNELATIKNSSGISQAGNVVMYTPSFSYIVRKYRENIGSYYSSSIFYGAADIQNSGSSGGAITYFQSRTAMYGVGLTAGWFLRPKTQKINIGFSIPIYFRHVSWPASPGLSIDRADSVLYGLMLDTQMRIGNNFSMNQRIGALADRGSTIWQVCLEWTK